MSAHLGTTFGHLVRDASPRRELKTYGAVVVTVFVVGGTAIAAWLSILLLPLALRAAVRWARNYPLFRDLYQSLLIVFWRWVTDHFVPVIQERANAYVPVSASPTPCIDIDRRQDEQISEPTFNPAATTG